MGLAALIAWLLTASIGGHMLRTWGARGGARDGAGARDAFTVTDERIASLLAEPVRVRRRRLHLLPLIPAVHGVGALSTFLLTVTAALLPVR